MPHNTDMPNTFGGKGLSELSERIYNAFKIEPGFDYSHTIALKQVFLDLHPLSANAALGIKSYDSAFEVRFVYNSNSIEGSTLTLGETALVLDGEFVPDRPGRDYFAARGSADGMAYYKKALSESIELSDGFIKNIHERTALDCQPAVRGVYRRHPVYIRGSEAVPANWQEVPLLMKDLIIAYSRSTQQDIYKAAVFHVFFEAIHPFADGNGRTGRLILNYMLESNNYPPICIKSDAKAEYLKSLENWQSRDDSALFTSLVNKSLIGELNERIACIINSE